MARRSLAHARALICAVRGRSKSSGRTAAEALGARGNGRAETGILAVKAILRKTRQKIPGPEIVGAKHTDETHQYATSTNTTSKGNDKYAKYARYIKYRIEYNCAGYCKRPPPLA